MKHLLLESALCGKKFASIKCCVAVCQMLSKCQQFCNLCVQCGEEGLWAEVRVERERGSVVKS